MAKKKEKFPDISYIVTGGTHKIDAKKLNGIDPDKLKGVHEVVRVIRLAKGWTQADLEKLLKLKATSICAVELGRVGMSSKKMNRFLKATKAKVTIIIDIENPEKT